MLTKIKEIVKIRRNRTVCQSSNGMGVNAPASTPTGAIAPAIGSDSSPGAIRPQHLAFFHTIMDMMTAISRIDHKRSSNPHSRLVLQRNSVSYLNSVFPNLADKTLASGTVWHVGCLIYGREGLRVLGTWIKPGWGLGITEIGRTGIFSPRNNL